MSGHPEGRMTAERLAVQSEGLQLSFDDVFEPTQAADIDRASRGSSPFIGPVGLLQPSPIHTMPDRTPMANFESVFTLSPQSLSLSLSEGDVRSSLAMDSIPSGASSPMSTSSFNFSPRSSTENGAGTSFDTSYTIPSPTSPSFSSKGKQRVNPTSLTFTPFEPETESSSEADPPPRLSGWQLSEPDNSKENELEAGPSGSHTTSDVIPRQDHEASASSGITLAMVYSNQRADPPKSVPMSRSESPSINTTTRTHSTSEISSIPSPSSSSGRVGEPASPSTATSSSNSRPRPNRSVSLGIKLKLKKSRDFVRSSGKSPLSSPRRSILSNPEDASPSSELIPEPTTSELLGDSTSPKITKTLLVRSYTTPAALTSAGLEYAISEGEHLPETPKERRNLFDELLPMELRLSVFGSLVHSFVDDLQKAVNSGEWTSARASQSPWVGWEGGIRELVKLSRVSRAWQALVFDGQLWTTLGGCPALPPSILTRISASAGPFVQSLQLEGAGSLTADDIVTIASRISTVGHHIPSIQFHSSVPIEHWCTNVTSINLAGCYGVTTRALHKLLASCPLLEHLCLRGLSAVTSTTCIVIGDAHPRLQSLDVSYCGSLDAFGMTFICEAIGRRRAILDVASPLKVLRLSGLKRVSDYTLASIARTFPLLEVLDLSYALTITDSCIESFVEWLDEDSSMPSAAEMRKRYHSLADEEHMPFVELTSRQVGLDPMDRTMYKRRVTRLRHLNLSHCPSLTDNACAHLAHAVPRLELLELAGIGAALEDEGLVKLLKTTPYIRKLDLEDASRITDDLLEALTPPPPSPSTRRPAPINIPNQRGRAASYAVAEPAVKTGERLEHLIVSYAALLTSDAIATLVRSCPKLHTLEADNTRLSDAAVREFVELQRTRGVQDATLVAIDCASVGRSVVDDLATKGVTRPRAGWRGWHARHLGYADAGDGDDVAGPWGPGLNECDNQRVTLKSFRSWQVVDKWGLERAKRLKSAAEASGPPSREGGKAGSRWFGGRRSGPSSGANTPRSMGEDDERGCIIM